MNSAKSIALLCALACVALLFAGCTTTTTTTIGNPTTAQTAAPAAAAAAGTAAQPAAPAAATPAPSTTPECPDKLVWDNSWDTRWMSYAGNHDIRAIAEGAEGEIDSWNGINAPDPTDVKLTQKCRDVTGTVAFGTDPVCMGTVTGKVDKNQLTGTWKTAGCEPEEGSTDGKFSLTMAADNQSWTGKIIGTKWLDWCSDCPPNWAGRKA